MGPTGPRWAPCWPHVPCYQGSASNDLDVWTELKKINGISKQTPVSVDGYDCDIVANLTPTYQILLSSNSEQSVELSVNKQVIDAKIVSLLRTISIYTESWCDEEIRCCPQKSDGKRVTDSNHFVYTSQKFKVYFPLWFTIIDWSNFIYFNKPARQSCSQLWLQRNHPISSNM